MGMFSSAVGLPRRLAMAMMSRFEPSETTELKAELADGLEPEEEDADRPSTG
jgi:hypothetical protein